MGTLRGASCVRVLARRCSPFRFLYGAALQLLSAHRSLLFV